MQNIRQHIAYSLAEKCMHDAVKHEGLSVVVAVFTVSYMTVVRQKTFI